MHELPPQYMAKTNPFVTSITGIQTLENESLYQSPTPVLQRSLTYNTLQKENLQVIIVFGSLQML